jgi:RimJ/RimL family protein N-acetyltransferase
VGWRLRPKSAIRASSAVIVREAQLGDAAGLCAYLSELMAERLPGNFQRDRAPTEEEERDFITEIANARRSVLLVAEASGLIVGVLGLRGDQRPQRTHVGAFGMSVARQWRRSGVGTKLLDAMLTWAAAHGLRRVELEVLANNEGAIALYRRAGFALEGTKVRAVEVDGHYIDLRQMAKLL